MHRVLVGISKLLWLIAIVGACYGSLEGALMVSLAESAPQQAAGTGMAMMYAVIPYVFARAWDEMALRAWPYPPGP